MTDTKVFTLRMPDDLREAVEKRAMERLRSINNEIVILLKLGLANEADESEALNAALETLVSQIDITGCSCIVSFPPEQIYFRNMSLPFKQAKKIKQILPFELEPTMPMPIDELVIDFHRIETGDDESVTRLIAATVDTQQLRTFLELLSGHGIDLATG